MAIFRPKPWIDPFEKMSIFRGFCTSFFYSLERLFFVLDYPMLYCLKKKVEKWSFLDQNHELICLEKCQFFDILNPFFYSLKWCFFVLEYRKRHFPGFYCLKQKDGKMAIFGPKQRVNPVGKMSIFQLFEPLFL